MASERVLPCELQSIVRRQRWRRTSVGAKCQSHSRVGTMGTIRLQTSAAVLPLSRYWDGERSPVTENAAGKQQMSHLFALNLLEFGIFGILFFFPPIRWNLSQSSKVMEMAQKTGWRCNRRSSLSLGNQLKNSTDWRNGPTAHYLVAIYISRSLSATRERGCLNLSCLIIKAYELETHF